MKVYPEYHERARLRAELDDYNFGRDRRMGRAILAAGIILIIIYILSIA